MNGTMIWPKLFDPVAQAQLWSPVRAYEWQKRVLRKCSVQGARVAVVTPNESGKTSLVIPVLGLSFMAAFPGSMVASTAGVERQIKSALWPVLRGSLAKYRNWIITEDLHIRAPSVNGIPASEWEAFSARDPQHAEGFHSRWYEDKDGKVVYAPLMIIIDEAKAFEGEEMMFAFLNRCSPDVLLMISTPGEDTGPFYDAFHKNRNTPWDCVEVTWQDCPHLCEGFKLIEREQKIKELGEDHPLIQSWVFGKFYRAGAQYVFDRMTDVDFAMGGMVPHVRGERRAALEFSAGGDEQVFGVRDGNTMVQMEAFHERDTTILGDRFIERFKRWNLKPEWIIGDEGGLGHPIIDYLERKGWQGIRRYKFGGDARNGAYYFNVAAENHYDLKYLMASRSINLINDQKLKDQIRRRRFIMPKDDSNRIRLEPKDKGRDRGEGSPDRLDMTVMLYSDMGPLNMTAMDTRFRRDPAGKCGYFADCHKQEQEGGRTAFWAENWGE